MAVAVICAASAHAAYYKMLLCAGNNGSNGYSTATNTTSASNPGGIFSFENHCGPAPDPAGESAFLRIAENQSGGNAGEGAFGSMSWTAPPSVAIVELGGYTREPGSFNAGWRARFWGQGFDGSTNNVLMQGTGVDNGSLGGIGWSTTGAFLPHLWPFGGLGRYQRFVFEMTCMRAACDRSGWNAVDANTMALVIEDPDPSHVGLANAGSGLLSGQWVRGTQNVTWAVSETGSGMRFERVRVDGGEVDGIDWRGSCDLGASTSSGDFARDFAPCPTGSWSHAYALNTAGLADGAHTVQVCAQDYAQAAGLFGSGSESCDQRTIHTDNTAPGAPIGLAVVSSNPARYLDRFGARFSLPGDSGSPIAKVHYYVTNEAGQVVEPEKVVSATNPTSLSGLEGPATAGGYILHVALEDQVGFVGPQATAPIPHDTTPPAAPQELHVEGTTAHRVASFGVRWSNIVDEGSPIDAAHYEVVDASGNVVAAAKTVAGEGVQSIAGIETPAQAGDCRVRVWVEDSEGNVGSAAVVAVPRDTTPPAAAQDVSVAAPDTSRSIQGFDVSWHNIVDEGSPIDAAHYRVVDGAGNVVVPDTTVTGSNIESIADLETPRQRGDYTLVLWLSDREGNVGAPVRVPLAYDCVRSDQGGGSVLSAGLGKDERPELLVRQKEGAIMAGTLRGQRGGVANAAVCVFSRVVTEGERRFLGVAMTGADGHYEFAVESGPSREVSAAYRPDQREVTADATLHVRVRPSFKVARSVVHNGHVAVFRGAIPGPHNSNVVVVIQVKSGKGWRVFRRYHTRGDGNYRLRYRFSHTTTATTYIMRAAVPEQSGYAYEEGESRILRLHVVP